MNLSNLVKQSILLASPDPHPFILGTADRVIFDDSH